VNRTLLFGVTGLEWLKAFGLAFGTSGALYLLRQVMVSRLRNAPATAQWLDDLFLLLAQKTSRLYMAAMGLAAAAWYLSHTTTLPGWVRAFAVAALCIQFLKWANAAVDFWLDRMAGSSSTAAANRTSLAVIGVIARAAIFIVVLALALDNFGVNVTALITGLGITGIAVALAVQNILGDLLAALAIALDKPFVVGDEITLGDVTGRVEKVGIKTTRLRLGTGEEVSVANAEVMKSRLTNVSRTQTRMVSVTVGIAAHGVSGAALLALAAACESAALSVPQVRSAKARLSAVIDGRARIVVESVLTSPLDLATVRPALIATLVDTVVAQGYTALGVG
jgi:small-conductance mechanosensitive channel